MDKNSKTFGRKSSGTDPEVSPSLKPGITVVNFPLTPEEDAWLRQQKKRVQDTYRELRAQEKSKTPGPVDED